MQSSRPEQACDSSIRCLPQKWPLQKPQSPTMRWASSRQSLKLQRGLRGGAIFRMQVSSEGGYVGRSVAIMELLARVIDSVVKSMTGTKEGTTR